MRLSETIIIYLAAAAPVGVIYFLRQQSETNARTLLRAVGAALVWPLVLVAFRLEGVGASKETEGASHRRGGLSENLSRDGRIERGKRELLSSLCRVEDLLEEQEARSEDLRQVMFRAREGVERYVGLALAAAVADADAAPARHELELFRVAGRTGEDLRLAGRCIHRRNVKRLLEHHARARLELLHALAEMRETGAARRGVESLENASRRRRASEAMLEVFGRAIDLLSMLEDRGAALGASRLLDAECARLKRLEVVVSGRSASNAPEGEICSTLPEPHSPHRERQTSLLNLSQPTTSTRG